MPPTTSSMPSLGDLVRCRGCEAAFVVTVRTPPVTCRQCGADEVRPLKVFERRRRRL